MTVMDGNGKDLGSESMSVPLCDLVTSGFWFSLSDTQPHICLALGARLYVCVHMHEQNSGLPKEDWAVTQDSASGRKCSCSQCVLPIAIPRELLKTRMRQSPS